VSRGRGKRPRAHGPRLWRRFNETTGILCVMSIAILSRSRPDGEAGTADSARAAGPGFSSGRTRYRTATKGRSQDSGRLEDVASIGMRNACHGAEQEGLVGPSLGRTRSKHCLRRDFKTTVHQRPPREGHASVGAPANMVQKNLEGPLCVPSKVGRTAKIKPGHFAIR